MFYAYDALGSVAVLSNHQGKLKTRYQYDAFGEVLAGDLSDNPYAFTGQRLDPESNLYHFHFRMYDAEVGVWTTADPIGVNGGINLYQYAFGNPVMFIDVLGLHTGGVGGPNNGDEMANSNTHEGFGPDDKSQTGLGGNSDRIYLTITDAKIAPVLAESDHPSLVLAAIVAAEKQVVKEGMKTSRAVLYIKFLQGLNTLSPIPLEFANSDPYVRQLLKANPVVGLTAGMLLFPDSTGGKPIVDSNGATHYPDEASYWNVLENTNLLQCED